MISARWMPHLLTNGQKKQRVKIAKQLLKIFPKYDEKKLAKVVTGDETWVYYFEPVRKVSNKIRPPTKTAKDQGPVVQSIVSLTSSLVVKMLTVLVSTISNSQVFLLKKM